MPFIERAPLRTMRASATAVAIVLGVAACNHDITTPLPPGVQPIGEDGTTPPDARDGDPYPEDMHLEGRSRDDLTIAVGNGFVHGDLATVWKAFSTPEVVADRGADELSFRRDTEPAYQVSFVVHNVVHDVITVSWDVTWREIASKGTREAPEEVRVRWQKTEGTGFIDTYEGSVGLFPVAPNVTRVELVQRIEAHGQTVDETLSGSRSLYDRVVAAVHKTPAP
ncbi:hypothetical protein AKJ09_08071 [Labilithrix luteola]|uniref:Lipoprotein n=1 Tax=Labilithrix luteola TaxID=1391654 RepID=A0A0K1Q6P6_9BACT|nr:hypothetical protein [Labilithrix luteola]AKV01408.1 hypothetical protein AKJ09_08071 [Labilithrix luteola]